MDLSYSHYDQLKYAAYQAAVSANAEQEGTVPHCDSRILHAPDECEYCDRPDLQAVRCQLGIAWTGYEPGPAQIPCEADLDRPTGSNADHRRWGGNKPTSADDTWPEETFASQVLYYHDPANIKAGKRIDFKPTKADKDFAPWYMKPVCRNEDGSVVGCDYKWWAKPFRRWL